MSGASDEVESTLDSAHGGAASLANDPDFKFDCPRGAGRLDEGLKRSLRPWVLLATLLVGLPVALAAEEGPQLANSAAGRVEEALDPGKILASGRRLRATAAASHVEVHAFHPDKTPAFTLHLVHPSAAPAEAPVVAGVVVTVVRGEASASELSEITARLRSAPRPFHWKASNAGPSAQPSKSEKPFKGTNLMWFAVLGLALIVGALWHHRRQNLSG